VLGDCLAVEVETLAFYSCACARVGGDGAGGTMLGNYVGWSGNARINVVVVVVVVVVEVGIGLGVMISFRLWCRYLSAEERDGM